MPYSEKSSVSFLGSLAMGLFAAIAGATLFALIFYIAPAVLGHLSPIVTMVIAVCGYAIIGGLVGGGIKGGGGRSGGILERIAAVILAYASMAVAMTAWQHGAGSVFHQSIVRTFSAPFASDAPRNFALMALGLVLAFVLAAGANTQAKPRKS